MMKAMVFAAGMGTRLKPLTDRMPKALVEVCGKPLLAHVIEKLKSAGYDSIVINVHHFADMIEEYVRSQDDFGIDIKFSDERAELLDTGGGLMHARSLLETDADMPDLPEAVSESIAEEQEDGRFLVHNVDIMSDLDIHRFVSGADRDALATLVVSERKTSRYLLFDNDMRLAGWMNVATGEVRSPYIVGGSASADSLDENCSRLAGCRKLAFSGIHLLSGKIFDAIGEWRTAEKFSIMDFYVSAADRYVIKGFVQPELKLMDVGKLDTVAAAEEFCRNC